ncbi:MAG: (d)CMP kinase [Oscillospiraceae bacterium]|nr:(d)CMP kinase [Oscillospiraceae bacterium]
MISVAIDGPSGAGKGSVASAAAKELGYLYVDTGAFYRAIGLYALRQGVDPRDEAGVTALLPEVELTILHEGEKQFVCLNGENVDEAIRAHEISDASSGVSAHPAVRQFLLDLQHKFAREHDVIMDGRDIGTVILPDAEVKIYLTASAEERARRRVKQLAEKKHEIVPFEQVLRDIEKRDYDDMHRPVAPLRQAEDAVLVDTTELTEEESVAAVLRVIREKVEA